MTRESTMNPKSALERESPPSLLDLARCLSCGKPLAGGPSCLECGRVYPTRDGITEAIAPLVGRNQIVAEFYDGPGWVRFRPWEQAFLIFQGGVRRARMEILRHLLEVETATARVLEVGIGSGENLAFLPPGWDVFGVDIARTQLHECLRRCPALAGHLAWAEAEVLPFADNTFDASYSVGGFNYFRNHEQSLREMCRVTKPGGPVVVADEVPGLHRAGLGHLLGVPSLDAWWLRKLGLDREFVRMVLEFNVDLASLAHRVWPQHTRHRIWHGMGYCLVERSGSQE
jgi:SAM-dependent methyltransferase